LMGARGLADPVARPQVHPPQRLRLAPTPCYHALTESVKLLKHGADPLQRVKEMTCLLNLLNDCQVNSSIIN
jgi:hypothetical protein